MYIVFFFQAEDGIRDLVRSRGLGDVYKRQEEDLSIRFTFDRLFEFFVGEHFFYYTLSNLKEEKGKLLFPIIRDLANNHIFWGAIKNVLLYYLRNEDTVSYTHLTLPTSDLV